MTAGQMRFLQWGVEGELVVELEGDDLLDALGCIGLGEPAVSRDDVL